MEFRLRFFLHFFRVPNILILLASVFLVYELPVRHLLEQSGLQPTLSHADLLLFMMAIGCTALAGYIDNNLRDQQSDLSNQKITLSDSRHVLFRYGRLVYGIILLTGAVPVLWLADRHQKWEWAPLYPIAGLLLLVYTRRLKSVPLLGNLSVALLCAAVPLTLYLAEGNQLHHAADPTLQRCFADLLLCFSTVTLLSNFSREIVKDMEDEHGDALHGIRSTAVALGRKSTIYVAFAAEGVFFILMLLIAATYHKHLFFLHATFLVFGLGSFQKFRLLAGSDTPGKLRQITRWQKGMMVVSLFYLIILFQLQLCD